MDEVDGSKKTDLELGEKLLVPPPETGLVVRNGLQLRSALHQNPLGCFSYALSSLTKGPVSLEKLIWHGTSAIQSEHIRCHVLCSNDDISQILAQYHCQHARAVVLINKANNYTLALSMLQVDIPVLVMTSEDGDKLLSILRTYTHPGDILAQIRPNDSEFLAEHSCSTIQRGMIKKASSSKQELFGGEDPWKEFKLYIYKYEEVYICHDKNSFRYLMSVFNRYESEAKSQSEGPGKQSENLLKKLLKHLEKIKSKPAWFHENFPFYVLLADRMHRKRDVYRCGDLDKFFETVMERVESLAAEKIAKVLNGFLKEGDFEITDGDVSVGVFQKLYDACGEILSVKLNKKHRKHQTLWITIAIQCCQSDINDMPRKAETLWNNFILEKRSTIILTKEVIDEIKKGLELGKILELPSDVQFTASRMQTLLFPHDQMRPLQHIWKFILAVKEFLHSEKEFVSFFMKASREHYGHLLFRDNTCDLRKHCDASVNHTVEGFVQEGVDFLEAVVVVIARSKHWDSVALKTQCKQWFSLLVKTVEIKRGGENTLQLLLSSDKGVTNNEDYRSHIETEVIRKTREMFGKLDIAVFYPLYREFDIWDNHFLSEYLSSYTSSHAELSDENWTLLFKEVVRRVPDASSQGFILQFLMSDEASLYTEAGKRVAFVLDLMKLDVPDLFASPPHNTTSERFQENLHAYISKEGLSKDLLENVDKIMDRIYDHPHSFQDLILTVLQKDITPHLHSLPVGKKPALKLLNTVIKVLNKNVCPRNNLTRKERFCWGVVVAFCEQIQPQQDSFQWAVSYAAVIEKMGEIYSLYCQTRHIRRGSQQCNLQDEMRPDIRMCPFDVVKYYEWIQDLHKFFSGWYEKFMLQELDHDDMVDYENSHSSLCKVAKAVCVTGMIIEDQHISELRTNYLQNFEQLNLLLLRYVPEVPRVKWRILPSVLNMYGIGLPKDLQVLLKQFIVLPGENPNSTKLRLQRHALTACTTGEFQPPQPISLMPSQGFTLKKMALFIRDLEIFLTPIMGSIDMLIFFTLHDSKLFLAYVQHKLKMNADLSTDLSADLSTFKQALVHANLLLDKLCRGKANYSQITANGAVNLETLDIQNEFSILLKSKEFGTISCVDNTLEDVRNMVDLLKVSSHIRVVRRVCEQYQLEGCLNDENLMKLTAIANELMTEEAKVSLTPSIATDKMDTVRELLGAKGGVGTHDYEYLAIFSKIADSAEFYQFICKKKFADDRGQARFYQQYQLITAQLQHEEYDEAVLNHLYAAYKLLLPFTVKKQSFHSLLMSVKQLLAASPAVTAMTTHDRLMQIETVNRNINLIQLWFSRAEGDTQQNVVNDLESIFQTGHYNFIIPENIADPGKVELMYRPSTQLASIMLAEAPSEKQTSVIQKQDNSVKLEIWDSEQTGTFVRKLGFLDSDKAGGNMVKPFLHKNEVANKLLEFLLKLREMGYPSHLTDVARNGLKCNVHAYEADQMVDEMEHTVKEWSQNIDMLLMKHNWLLLFNISKILRLSKLLRSAFHPDSVAVNILEEISFLFCSDVQARKEVVLAIKDTLNASRKKMLSLEQANDASIPLSICGTFLDKLLKHSEIVDYSLRKYDDRNRLVYPARGRRSLLHSAHSIEVLHSAPDFSQGELISVIVNIYDGRLPQPYEFFRCHENTSLHELKLFLTRAVNHPLTFIILEVNLLPIQLQEVVLRQHLDFHASSDHEIQPCIHYMETLPSILHEMPWIQQEKHKLSDVMKLEDVQKICHQQAVVERGLSCIQLVYGAAGVGKTHYIRKQLANCQNVTVAINEGFEPIKAIKQLHVLPRDRRECAIFFNFNLIPPFGDPVSNEDRQPYDTLMETISWFFFDLLFLGYVEDSHSGESFHLPGGLSWSIYVEVPARSISSCVDEFLEEFKSEVPIFKLLGTTKLIQSDTPYSVDWESSPDVQLVCKYLKAYETGGRNGIDRLYRGGQNLVRFSTEPDLSGDVCERLLAKYVPASIRSTKITQQLFLRYMKRRCWFLDNLPAYNFNTGRSTGEGRGQVTDTTRLGSTLMATMIREAEQFCHPCIEKGRDYHQLIYDGEGSIGFISTAPHKLTELKKIGVEIPTMVELHQREYLDKCLSRALNIPLNHKKRLTAIDDENYVLTFDFTIKMLQIHERYECGEPVIIQGETGVGKTALVQMLSKLWNASLDMELKRLRERLLEFLQNRLKHGSSSVPDQYKAWLQAVDSVISGVKKSVEEDDLMLIAMLPCREGHLYLEMKNYLKKIAGNPLFPLLEITCQRHKPLDVLFNEAAADSSDLADYSPENEAKPVVKVFHALLTAAIKSTFHKISVHAAMKPADLSEVLGSVFEQAQQLKKATEVSTEFIHAPNVTVFLDELNASTCGGLFKEMIIDRTFEGKSIPENVFIVAACNPHRGNSLAALNVGTKTEKSKVIGKTSDETWMMDSYYVRQLHPTLAYLMWDYGSLGEDQERQYVLAKVDMQSCWLSDVHKAALTEVIVSSQKLIRQYAFEELKKRKLPEQEAKQSSKCCVSQRDIQRIFTFYKWLLNVYQRMKPHNDDDITSCYRAILVALGIVYYMRLNRKYRARYEQDLSLRHKFTVLKFSEVFQSELEWYTQQVEFPKGIAKTQALKENLFAIIVCTVTQTPLIIVGAPGTSKTLSFNIVMSNLKGQESKRSVFRNTDIFLSLDPHFYQCSRCTTSNEIQTVFSRAITRQQNNAIFSLPIKCVVFMDEAGLPEHSHESLKVLHSHLDNPSVSFVAISNTVLDAAKTNRAVSLFRDPTEITEYLGILATECLFESPDCPPPSLKEHIDVIVDLQNAYTYIITEMKLNNFFGLRDFIHFLHYIRRKCVQRDTNLSLHQVGQLVTESLERNFSGSQQLSEILEVFLCRMNLSTAADLERRDEVLVFKDSLNDMPGMEDEVRYKIVIHSSEDDSLVRLLFQYKVLERQNTRIYICSDYHGDSELQKIDTIAGIRHSAIQGHSIVMIQTDEIHESFYDLFNQRFQKIDDPISGTRLYANIAIGAQLKPCRVDPKFQCVVAIKKSELDRTPAPFLNRFEKYYITHKHILESVLKSLPTEFQSVIKAAYKKVQQFIQCVGGSSSLYGLCEETVDSLLLTILPPNSKIPMTDMNVNKAPFQHPCSMDSFENAHQKQICILQMLTETLKMNFNLCYQQCSAEELDCDAAHLFDLVLSSNPEFEGVMRTEMNDVETARIAVQSALDTLLRVHGDSTYAVPPVTKLIWSLLLQWLVRHFCKALMQLMTPEALVLHERQIPASYIHNYLTFQKHFSLKDLIQQQLDKIAMQEKRPNTKLLCFTRTSPLIHNLPSMYPTTVHSVKEKDEYEINLTNQVFCHVSELVVCKMESTQSQRSVKESLKTFLGSEKSVMLLLANMQEVSTKTVNHLRVMMEEEEATAIESFKPKLFVLLLHFPPAMYSTACYPSLFLEGWDHYYLDTIAHGLSHGIVDSVEWFHMSCFPIKQSLSSIEDSFFLMLKHLLCHLIPHVVSRLSFGSDDSRPFNRQMNSLERSEALQKLFNTELGDALCHHFRSYWKPEVLTEYLHRAVKFTRMGQTTLNITDSIHSIIKSHFLDFVVYMVDYMNDNYNLDTFFSPHSTEEVKQLFLDLTKCLPIPQKLSKLKILSNIQHGLCYRKAVTGKYRFPYFGVVCPQILDIVKDAACKLFQSEDSQDNNVGQIVFEEQLQKQVEEHLVGQMKGQNGCVSVAVAAMGKHRELWDRYCHDFTREQLSLWQHNQQVVEETLKAAFGNVCAPSASAVSQLASLHVYTHLNQSSISKNIATLASLVRLTSISEQASGKLHSSSSTSILLTTKDTSTFVLNTLFNVLLTSSGRYQASTTDMKLWYNAYHAMIHSPAVRKHIYQSLSATSEAKLNVMHAAFLAVQYDSSDNDLLTRCQAMVNGLCSDHFMMPSLELKGWPPHIAEVSSAVAKAFGQPQATEHSDAKPDVELFIMEGLLTHFFCYYEKADKNNIWWLLGHINEQKHWLRTSSHLSQISPCDTDEIQSQLRPYSNSYCVPIGVFKYYLLKILGSCNNAKEESSKQWVPPYETEGRAVVEKFLKQQVSSDVPGTYVPPIYQLPGKSVSEHGLESQPLAYLYFLTVLEYLVSLHSDLSNLLTIAMERMNDTESEKRILCCIEKQALVQVIIREFAKHLTEYDSVASKLTMLQKSLKCVLDEQTSGEKFKNHGDILAMYLLKEAQSLEKFTRLITEQYDTHCATYTCFQRFHRVLKEPYNSRVGFFHLLHQEDQSSQLGKLYQQVQRIVMAIAEGKAKPSKLIKLAKESQKSQMLLPASSGSSEGVEKLSCVKMMIWLTVYKHLYNKETQSKELTDACSKHFDKPFVQLIRWFGSPKDLATPGPLSDLFSPSSKDSTDIQIRHAVANLVASALGTWCTVKMSSHLWYLIFTPEALRGTYLAGYMNDAPISVNEGRPYQEGVQITTDELSRLLQHAIGSGLSLNSRCMLLWINVASFCVSLLTQGHERLSGILFSTTSIEEYCVSQLRHIWKFMRTNMQLTDEELSYLVMMCMRRNLQCWTTSQDSMRGIFYVPEKVAAYERHWHTNIFLPCLKKLRDEFYACLSEPLRKLIVDIRHTGSCYPHFADNTTALYSLLSFPDVQVESQEKIMLLSRFICKLPEVQTTLPYLPDFMEFYQWLHKDLAGVLTPERANKMSIKSLVKQMSKHYAGERGDKLMSLYERVKDGYHHCLKAAGGTDSPGGFDGICVRNFLTLDASTMTANTDEDILYKIICEIVTCHNALLECIEVVALHSKETHLNRYLLSEPITVKPVDVTENACILSKSEKDNLENELLQLVSRRHKICMATDNVDVTRLHLLTADDLLKLQEDVASLYLCGRPRIKNISSVHIPFVFRSSKHTSEAHPLNFGQDLNQVGKLLPAILKHDFTDNHTVLQLLEREFHSADYNTMLDVVTGLKTAIALLEKQKTKPDVQMVQKTGSDGTDLHSPTLNEFLGNNEEKGQDLDLFGKRLSGHQLSTLMNLRVSCLYHTFTTFTQWLVEGYYDFHQLPYTLKAHLNLEDAEQLKKIPSVYKKGCEPMDLLREFKLLGEVLDHLQSNLLVVGTQVSLVDYLTPMVIFEGHDEFLGLIPKTILIQHYVSLRILLKHLTAEVHQSLPTDKENEEKPWLELVPRFSDKTVTVNEAIQADYGLTHGYDSDSETCSCDTQCDLLHEDQLDEYSSLQTCDLKTGGTSSSVNEPVSQSLVDALQQAPMVLSDEAKEVTETDQQTGMAMLASTPPVSVLGPSSSVKQPVSQTSVDALQQAPTATSKEAKEETDEKQLLQCARQYTSQAVANFVISIGYPDHAELFEDNDYSGDVLVECEDEDLKDLGIESALARLKIIILFRRQLQGLHSVAKNFPADKVVDFLDGLKPQEKEQYKQSFSRNQIDGEMLLAMKGNHDVMIELGVKRAHSRMIWTRFQTLVDTQSIP